jgi:transposase-like protein
VAKRIDEKTKTTVLDFVEHAGRGGVSAAAKKWGISALTIRNWVKQAGASNGSAAKSPAVVETAAAKPTAVKRTARAKKNGAVLPVHTNGVDKKGQVVAKLDAIQTYERQIAELAAKIDRTKQEIVELVR